MNAKYKILEGQIRSLPFLKAIQEAGLEKKQAYRAYTVLKDLRNLDRCRYADRFKALVDAKTGELHWRERLNAQFSSSPTFADGYIYLSDRKGVTHVLKPGKTFKVLTKNKLDGTAHMASFAPHEKAFLVRTEDAFYRIESR